MSYIQIFKEKIISQINASKHKTLARFFPGRDGKYKTSQPNYFDENILESSRTVRLPENLSRSIKENNTYSKFNKSPIHYNSTVFSKEHFLSDVNSLKQTDIKHNQFEEISRPHNYDNNGETEHFNNNKLKQKKIKLNYAKNDGFFNKNSSHCEIGQEAFELNQVSPDILHCVNNYIYDYLMYINIFFKFLGKRETFLPN